MTVARPKADADLARGAAVAEEVTSEARRLEAFRAIQMRSAADEVVLVVADAIRGGLFEQGDRLPRERDLATRLGVSRTAVREGLSVLRRAGVLSVRRGASGGSYIVSLAALPEVLSSLHGQTQADLHSVLEVRRALETTAALFVARNGSSEDLARLERLVVLLEECDGDYQEFYETDLRFHLAIGQMADNPPLAGFLRETFDRITLIRSQFPVGSVELTLAIKNQRETFAALQEGSPEVVVDAVDRHLAAFEEHFLGKKLDNLYRRVD
jgi:GntR family transcriptional regulator, transcriptional repressor for pyruvate dehydrogenase complex